jgi:hypothetical protein
MTSKGAVSITVGQFCGKKILLYFSLGSPTACCCCCELAATTFYETSRIITIKGTTESEKAFGLFDFSSLVLVNRTSYLLGGRSVASVPQFPVGPVEKPLHLVVDCCVVDVPAFVSVAPFVAGFGLSGIECRCPVLYNCV